KMMATLTHDPVLGHITTFGGHPVSCAAGKAALEVLLEGCFIETVFEKEKILIEYIKHPAIQSINTAGLWMSLQFESPELNQRIVHQCVQNGLITDWFLFAPDRLRIAPPLIITNKELREMCAIVLKSIDELIK
ncbi:MAG: aminotransferase class III-fold pyridoxal phosphate-dependent enzyme, partial [Chitinophagaceae bacterium]|nr:aminotransferase class III-fold pyridoxal phosphate-dependent enzyme [Chitinophagaceae bacterium]